MTRGAKGLLGVFMGLIALFPTGRVFQEHREGQRQTLSMLELETGLKRGRWESILFERESVTSGLHV